MSDPLRLSTLATMMRQSLATPRAGAGTVLALALPMRAVWLVFALTIVATMFLSEASGLVLGPAAEGALAPPPVWLFGAVQAFVLLCATVLIAEVGARFGGTGGFKSALTVMSWLQVIFVAIQALQLVLLLVAPLLGALVSLASIALFFWLLVNFIAELHGFDRLGPVALGTFLGFLAVVITISFVLALMGVSLEFGAQA